MNPLTLGALLDDRAAETPAAPAFTCSEERVTWGELAARVDALALALVEAGLEPGDRVAVMGQTTGAWAIADLAILLAGGVSVGIYPSLPPRQVTNLLGDCGARIAFGGSPGEIEALESARCGAPTLETTIGWGAAELIASLSFSALVRAGRDLKRRDPEALALRADRVLRRGDGEPSRGLSVRDSRAAFAGGRGSHRRGR